MLSFTNTCKPEDFYKLTIISYTLRRIDEFLARLDSILAEHSASRVVITHLFKIVSSFITIKLYYQLVRDMLTIEDEAQFKSETLKKLYPFSEYEISRINKNTFNFDHFRALDRFLNLFIFDETNTLTCHENREIFKLWKVIENDVLFLV
jgi:hypothetical protein